MNALIANTVGATNEAIHGANFFDVFKRRWNEQTNNYTVTSVIADALLPPVFNSTVQSVAGDLCTSCCGKKKGYNPHGRDYIANSLCLPCSAVSAISGGSCVWVNYVGPLASFVIMNTVLGYTPYDRGWGKFGIALTAGAGYYLYCNETFVTPLSPKAYVSGLKPKVQ